MTCAAAGAAPAAVPAPPAERPFYAPRFPTEPAAAALSALGRRLFGDPTLSASGRTACATCHSPRHAFGPPDDLPTQPGGADGRTPGIRAVPSLRYLQTLPPFTEHFTEDEGDDSVDQGPAGGHDWDGRAGSVHQQAAEPLLSPHEMANPGPGAVVAAVRRSTYAAQFRAAFGAHIFDDPALAFQGVLRALETYQQEPGEFYPYTSKYDAVLRGAATLTPAEARGLDAFNDPARGDCARCHPSAPRGGALPQFTDFGFAGIGPPRNPRIAANADPAFHDLGLCGPLRTDVSGVAAYCGLFRTPSLRNVATRRVFFHNGVLHRLADVVRFYAERDTRPAHWYPRDAAGTVQRFDDLPPVYRRNLEPAAPSLSAEDVTAIVAFLGTLTDGYRR